MAIKILPCAVGDASSLAAIPGTVASGVDFHCLSCGDNYKSAPSVLLLVCTGDASHAFCSNCTGWTTTCPLPFCEKNLKIVPQGPQVSSDLGAIYWL